VQLLEAFNTLPSAVIAELLLLRINNLFVLHRLFCYLRMLPLPQNVRGVGMNESKRTLVVARYKFVYRRRLGKSDRGRKMSGFV
jgi:hypothetical protein